MPIKAPLHLYRNRHGTFYFRLLIPHDLRGYASRTEFRFSLHTEQRHQAIIAAIHLKTALPELFADLRRMSENNTKPPSDYFQRWLQLKRQNIDLQYRVEELQVKLEDAERQLINSVPRQKAERVVKSAYTSGQLRGKQELETRLVFPPPAENTAPFSVLKAAYIKSLTVRAEGGRKKPPTQETLDDYDKTLDVFIRVMGDQNIGAIDKEIAGEYTRFHLR